MINHILAIFTSICIYEYFKFINFPSYINLNLKIYKKHLKLFNYKKVSDSRKEKLFFHYSKSLIIVSIKILLILIIIFFFLLLVSMLSKSFTSFIFTFFGILEVTLIIFFYHKLRNFINAKL